TGALYGLSTMLLKIISDLKPDYIIACYDLPKPTYRHEAYKDYKAGRAKADDELVSQLKKSYDIFSAFNIPVYSKEGFEADDMIGTIVEETKKTKDFLNGQVDIVIASGDMDTLQLVSDKKIRVYTLKKGIKDTIIYDEDMVKARFGFGPELLPDYKGLRGDPSDNIIGIKGIGEKTASDLIKNFGSIENIYKKLSKDKNAFIEAGIKERIVGLLIDGEEEAKFSKMLGTIRKDAPIDFKIPEKTWKENLDVEKVISVWTELEFRTLGARLKETISPKSKVESLKQDMEMIQDSRPNDYSVGQAGFKIQEYDSVNHKSLFMNHESDRDFKEISVMLWLYNSNLTSPKIEDIFNFTNKKNLEDAKIYLEDELKKQDIWKVWEEIEKPLVPVIEKMEKIGVKIDKIELEKLSKEYHEKLSILEKKIWEFSGGEFNINSPKQLGEILFVKLGLKPKNQKKTGSGALSTKESELEKMRDMHPIIPLIFEYREFQKLLSTYIDVIPNLLDENNRLHAKFLQAGTTTGRLASSEPNLQNIPNSSELGRNIRKAFIAEDGFKIVAFDYSQIELRIAAFLSQDKKLIDIFNKGEDIHSAVASEVFNVPIEKVDKEMRRRAKVINFGIMYGMGVNSLRVNLQSSKEEAQKYLEEYFNKFSGLAQYLENVKRETENRGYTETFFGRRRYFEGIKSKLSFIKAMAERMAINAPIQGTEADIIKIAMVKIDEYIVKEKLEDKVKLTLQVHDELVYEITDESVEKVKNKIKGIMESIINPEKIFGIVCKADIRVGENWKEME
ncbi:MAG: DNA polymerase, partial [Candidatus Taylorbacteria bacterium]|nr:DNA polymerase [Candidatus Taylorbacteria bacterium]